MRIAHFLRCQVESSRGLFWQEALAQQTPALILDEPTNHLDITHQIMLMELVKKLNVTVISAIHDLNIAAAYCDKIYVLKRWCAGRIWNSTGSTHSGADQKDLPGRFGSGKMTAAGRCIFFFYNMRIDRPESEKNFDSGLLYMEEKDE